MALTSGARLGTYDVLALRGAGGMGEVYRARDSRLKREVAVKVLPDEAEMLATLNLPNIAAVDGLEQADASPGPGQAAVRALIATALLSVVMLAIVQASRRRA